MPKCRHCGKLARVGPVSREHPRGDPLACSRAHAEEGWVYLDGRCRVDMCPLQASFARTGDGGAPRFCAEHARTAPPDPQRGPMVNTKIRRATCAHAGCGTVASYGVPGTKIPIFCARHGRAVAAATGAAMEDVRTPKYDCRVCGARAKFVADGEVVAAFCREHAPPGAVIEWKFKRARRAAADAAIGRQFDLAAVAGDGAGADAGADAGAHANGVDDGEPPTKRACPRAPGR